MKLAARIKFDPECMETIAVIAEIILEQKRCTVLTVKSYVAFGWWILREFILQDITGRVVTQVDRCWLLTTGLHVQAQVRVTGCEIRGG